MTATLRGNRGFTLMEIIVVIGVIGLLAAILTPIVANYIDQSRIAAAQTDVNTIGNAISRFEMDLGFYPMFGLSNTASYADTYANVYWLYGASGTVPKLSGGGSWSSGATDTIEDQLLTNTPSGGSAYPTSGSLQAFRWKGPYITSQTDPWGDAYLVNIINCTSNPATNACFVLSAGPDGVIQTPFNNPRNSTLSPSGDDIIFRIR